VGYSASCLNNPARRRNIRDRTQKSRRERVEPPTIYQRDIYISETSLYDLTKNQLVWSGTVQTVDPSDINKEIKRYVDTVIEALKSKNLLPSK
jgi:hypothetical protein